MDTTSSHIALIDFSCSEGSIYNFLSEYKFRVTILSDRDTAIKSCRELKPDLIMYRTASSDNIETVRPVIHNLKKSFTVPVVLAPQTAEISLYLAAIEEGIHHFIQTPCSDTFMIRKIEDILALTKNDTPGDEMTVDLSFNEKTYIFRYNDSSLSRLLVSLLENNFHQNMILNTIASSRNGYDSRMCDGIFLDEDIMTDAEKLFEKKLFDAYSNGEMELYYQPVMSIADEKLIGFESLIRWNDPVNGILMPDMFIPAIEKSSLILPIGYWIVEEAAKQLKTWNDSCKNNPHFRISINLSASQFIHEELFETVYEIVNRYQLNPENFAIEITESALMENIENANLMLLKFKSKSFPIYMDDFGTGYSSLSYLQYFPVDTLKIDKSFVEWMHIDEQSEQIVRTVIALAHNLKKSVVAEGVEQKEHISLLKELGCDFGQGYYYSEPLPPGMAGELLRKYGYIS